MISLIYAKQSSTQATSSDYDTFDTKNNFQKFWAMF